MKFCEDHWTRLKEKIEQAGLKPFLAKSDEEAMHRTVAEEFEPLMDAHWAIVMNLTRNFGAVVLMYDGCPICKANESHDAMEKCSDPECTGPKPFDLYLDRATEGQVAIAKELGLIMSA